MKNLKRILVHTILYCFLSVLCVSCELFGLDFQKDYDNKFASVQTELDVTCYEFIKDRSKLDMSLFYEAIEHAELKNLYETDSLTYFLLNDEQFAAWLTSYRYPSVKSIPKTILQDFLKSYTIKGIYHSSGLSTSPIEVLSLNEVKTIRLRLYPNPSTSSQNLNAVNVGFVLEDGTVNYRNVITSNLRTTNGIAHLLQIRL